MSGCCASDSRSTDPKDGTSAVSASCGGIENKNGDCCTSDHAQAGLRAGCCAPVSHECSPSQVADCCSSKSGSVSKTSDRLADNACCVPDKKCSSDEEPLTDADGCSSKNAELVPNTNLSAASGGCCPGPCTPGQVESKDVCRDIEETVCTKECIKAIAALECRAACDSETMSDSVSSRRHYQEKGQDSLDPSIPDEACASHLTSAFERYLAYLESARCLCRKMIAQHGISCCDVRSAPQKQSATRNNQPFATGCHRAADGAGSQTIKRRSPAGKKACRDDGQDLIQQTCCKTAGACIDQCSENDNTKHEQAKTAPKLASTFSKSLKDDPEKAEGREKILLSVEGMTCTGCANKLQQTLESFAGISDIKVSFVMGTVEFDLSNEFDSLDKVMRQIQQNTGFSCTRVLSGHQNLDVLMSKDAAHAISASLPFGVDSIERLDRHTHRITYNPNLIGPRPLLTSLGIPERCLAPPRQDSSLTSGRKRLLEMLILSSLAAVFTIPVVVLAWGHTIVGDRTKGSVSVALATVVQVLAIPEFYKPAMTSLIRNQVVEMDLLVVISITAAYVYSVTAFGFSVAGRPLETKESFETSTLLITLVLLGRLIAAFARMKAVSAVSLRSLQSATAMLIEGGITREVDARLLHYGDIFAVPPHTQVPTDAKILEGSTEIDESMVTGENLPVSKGVGEDIIAGTVNGSGRITALLTRLPGANTVTDIAQLVEQASSAQPPIQALADKVAGYFVPVVGAISLIVLIVWLVIGVKTRLYSSGRATGNAVTYTVAVLAISCPCALGLAVPMVLVIAGGVAARHGVVIKSAESTETAHRVNAVVFDKTGTITTGELDVVAEEHYSDDHEHVMRITAGMLCDNQHPVSVAVAKHLSSRSITGAKFQKCHSIPGAGVEATMDGSRFRAGNASWLGVTRRPEVQALIQLRMTILAITQDDTLVAVFGLQSSIRPEARRVVQELHRRRIEVHLVSGDQSLAVQGVAEAVGIRNENVVAQRSPAEKQVYVKDLMQQGKKVLFCGDGTNDAVAIAQATVGVQIGSSSDVTRATADVILLTGLGGIISLIDISRAAFYRIMFNFAWSAIYNVFAITLASGAFVRVRISPAYAGLGELVSILPVIAVASTMSIMRLGSTLHDKGTH